LVRLISTPWWSPSKIAPAAVLLLAMAVAVPAPTRSPVFPPLGISPEIADSAITAARRADGDAGRELAPLLANFQQYWQAATRTSCLLAGVLMLVRAARRSAAQPPQK
jgi:hypothetical protein